MTQHKTSLETHAASHTSSAINMTVIAVAVTTGLILVTVAISVVIALAREDWHKSEVCFSIQQAGMRCQSGCVVW
jgi:hypothetical protein